MHPDIKEFQTLLSKGEIRIGLISEATGLAVQTIINIKKSDPDAKWRASTVAKVQDFLKAYKRGEIHPEAKEKPQPQKETKEEKILTFGEHLDMAIHLCPPTCKLQIILEKNPH